MKKRIAALFIALLAAIAFSQPQTGGFGTGGNTGRLGPSFNSLAFFEFAPASGAGMGSACACANVTGAKGEVLTFARAGSATCSRQGLATTGIANGDLVTCSSNLPRAELSGGVVGLRVESSRSNLILRSEQVNDAVWVKEQDSAPRTPTVTADQGVAPDGTSTADRVQFPATSGVEYSDYYQSVTAAGSNWTCSVYVRGFSGSGTTDVCSFEGTGWSCSPCSFSSTSWSLCSSARATSLGISRFCKVGNNSFQNGGVARAASDVLVWGHQGEEGTYGSSYIATVAASATRSADSASFGVSVPTASGVCTSATTQVPSLLAYASGGGVYAPMLSQLAGSASSPYLWPFTAGAGASLAIDAAGSSGVPTFVTPALDNPTLTGRYVAGHNGTSYSYCVNSTCRVNGSSSAWSSPTYQFIRLTGAGDHSQIWTNVQVDPAFSRCSR